MFTSRPEFDGDYATPASRVRRVERGDAGLSAILDEPVECLQFSEKLIPVADASTRGALRVYAAGYNVRDWHCVHHCARAVRLGAELFLDDPELPIREDRGPPRGEQLDEVAGNLGCRLITDSRNRPPSRRPI